MRTAFLRHIHLLWTIARLLRSGIRGLVQRRLNTTLTIFKETIITGLKYRVAQCTLVAMEATRILWWAWGLRFLAWHIYRTLLKATWTTTAPSPWETATFKEPAIQTRAHFQTLLRTILREEFRKRPNWPICSVATMYSFPRLRYTSNRSFFDVAQAKFFLLVYLWTIFISSKQKRPHIMEIYVLFYLFEGKLKQGIRTHRTYMFYNSFNVNLNLLNCPRFSFLFCILHLF